MADGVVLVTGASGFIATHIVQQLLEAGFRVRGTVRSLQDDRKVSALRDLCPSAQFPLDLVEADLTNPSSWTQAVRGCTYVMHTASPLPLANPKHQDDVIRPAVDGTLSVLRACHEAGTVKRVVMTSSAAAVNNGAIHGTHITFNEKDWADPALTGNFYMRSKVLAERAAWDYVEGLTEEERFELVTILPGFVIGPVICGGMATSMELPKQLLEHKIPALPHINMPTVDVRDVAFAHIRAMTKPEAAGRRFIVVNRNVWFKEIAVILRDEFRKYGYNVATKEAPACLLKLAALFRKDIKVLVNDLGKVVKMENTMMIQLLGVDPRGVKESVLDMGYSMINKGFVKKTNKYREVHAG